MNIRNLTENYLKDNTANEYHITLKLINNNDIAFSTTKEEFEKIKEWYEKKDQNSYLIKQGNKYNNLNKINIIEFSYIPITKKRNVCTQIMYILTAPVPKAFSMLSYIKTLFLIPIILLLYMVSKKIIFNADINILTDKLLINQTINSIVYAVTFLFFLYYILLFTTKLLDISNKSKDYFYEVEIQRMNNLYSYGTINFFVISFISYSLLTINFL